MKNKNVFVNHSSLWPVGLILACLVFQISAAPSNPVKKVVVLMMENRSFDHLLGWLQNKNQDIDGLDSSKFNFADASDPTSRKIYVDRNAPDRSLDDPGHTFEATTREIYGYDKPVGETAIPSMSGFVDDARLASQDLQTPMSMFTPTTAPIINTLAEEFVVMNRWFSSVPGPTDPNRAFAMSGTANGMVTNFNQTLFSQQSYFDFLTQNHVPWKAYYHDDPWAIMYWDDVVNKPGNAQNVERIEKFFSQLEKGELADFTWLQPRLTTHAAPPDWQHPDALVSEGERLIKKVYEALRASKFWEELVFVLTYDEHGGFYDHVPPPQEGVPPPDGVKSPEGFSFDRLGVRVPTLIISPWVEKGSSVFEPEGPQETSQYDSTSILSTSNHLFGIPHPINPRVSWSGQFHHLFLRSPTPRLDCPKKLPGIPSPPPHELTLQQGLPLNDHMEIQVEYYCVFNGHGEGCEGRGVKTQLEASLFIAREAEVLMKARKVGGAGGGGGGGGGDGVRADV